MKNKTAQSKIILVLISILLTSSFIFEVLKNPRFAFSQTANYLVISEVQVSGNSANEEFIELYNPTSSEVDISGWSIQRETTGGTFSRKNFESGNVITAHGYFLIAHDDFTTISPVPDMTHSTFTLSATGSTVFLVNNQTTLVTGEESSIVDKVAVGVSAQDAESTPFAIIPGGGQSIERKPGDSLPNGGNGEDSDNNSEDFALRNIAEPQNTETLPELPATPPVSPSTPPTQTPTVGPTPTDVVTPTVTPTVMITSTPTPTPTPTLTPTVTITPTPTVTPTLTPTLTPSPVPTAIPTPTLEPSPTPEPTMSVTPTVVEESPTPTITPEPSTTITPTPKPVKEGRVIGLFNFPGRRTVCRIKYRPVHFFHHIVFVPQIQCK